jgi:ABC-type polysaccharide/polyol phosphate export permease
MIEFLLVILTIILLSTLGINLIVTILAFPFRIIKNILDIITDVKKG